MRRFALLTRLVLVICLTGVGPLSYGFAGRIDIATDAGAGPIARPIARTHRSVGHLILTRAGTRISRAAIPHHAPLAVLAAHESLQPGDLIGPAAGPDPFSRRSAPRFTAPLRGPPLL